MILIKFFARNPKKVCVDAALSANCTEGVINSTSYEGQANRVGFEGMVVPDIGLCIWHMELGTSRPGVCSCTFYTPLWPDNYDIHW